MLDRAEDFNSYSAMPLSAPFPSRGSISGGLVSPLTRGELFYYLKHLKEFVVDVLPSS